MFVRSAQSDGEVFDAKDVGDLHGRYETEAEKETQNAAHSTWNESYNKL